MLVAFDFDGTLSDSEMTVLLGSQNGTADDMADITERAMNDGSSTPRSSASAVRCWLTWTTTSPRRPSTRSASAPARADVVAALRDAGHYVTILTGGFERGVAAALEHEGVTVDSIVANRLLVEDGRKPPATSGARTSPGRRTTRWRSSPASSTRTRLKPWPSATAPTTSRCSRWRASPSASTRNPPWSRPATRPSRRCRNWRPARSRRDSVEKGHAGLQEFSFVRGSAWAYSE